MKKLFALISVLFVGTMMFAASGSYIVDSFEGNVSYESAPGKFTKVKVGQELSASTVIKVITIKAKQKGSVESLFAAATPAKGGLKKQSIAKADAVDSATGSREGVATASSRASEAKEDFAWEE